VLLGDGLLAAVLCRELAATFDAFDFGFPAHALTRGKGGLLGVREVETM
jgi:hypothetical protein